MARRIKRQALPGILIIVLMYGLTWFGLWPDIGQPNQIKAFSPGSFSELPLRNAEHYPGASSLWQVNHNDIAFFQGVTLTNPNRMPVKNASNMRGISYVCPRHADSGHSENSARTFNIPSTVFKFTGAPNYQRLDIPPPLSPASL